MTRRTPPEGALVGSAGQRIEPHDTSPIWLDDAEWRDVAFAPARLSLVAWADTAHGPVSWPVAGYLVQEEIHVYDDGEITVTGQRRTVIAHHAGRYVEPIPGLVCDVCDANERPVWVHVDAAGRTWRRRASAEAAGAAS